MLHLLQRHPLAMKTHMTSSLVLAYALPAEVLTPLLAPGLTLDTYGDLGFLAIAMVKTNSLRPAFLPEAFGMSFFLAGYRIFTRYKTNSERNLRGLRILRTETDRRSLKVFGNLLTHYNYKYSDCKVSRTESSYDVAIRSCDGAADLEVEANISAESLSPPAGSPFPDLRAARMFAGPLPFTFDYERETHSMIRVEGVRKEWKPMPVAVTVRRNTFFDQKEFRSAEAVLANAFYLENIPYAWKPGIREVLK